MVQTSAEYFMTGPEPGLQYFSAKKASRFFILLCVALLASGCQEDRGQSKAASADAGAVSQSRLDNAVSSLQNTLGQQQTKTVDRPTLRWEAPVTREDGSRLYSSDIQEYRIYYRLRHEPEFSILTRPAGDGTSFTLAPFQPGAYEFSVTAVDSEGRESRRSDEVKVDLI